MMKLLFLVGVFCVLKNANASYYGLEEIDFIIQPQVYQIQTSDTHELWLIQYYNSQNSDIATETVKELAHALEGYVQCAIVDTAASVMLPYIMQFKTVPTYVLYGYYKHLPTIITDIKTTDDIFAEVFRQLHIMFVSKIQKRFLNTSMNYEMDQNGINFNNSLLPWAVIYYDPDCNKCIQASEIWNQLIQKLQNVINFASVNNPLYTFIDESELNYPIIKFFPTGKKSNTPDVYSDLIEYEAINKFLSGKIKASKVRQLISYKELKLCAKRRYCIFTYIPSLEHCDTECRIKSLNVLGKNAEKYKNLNIGWLWNENGEQMFTQEFFEVSFLLKTPVIVITNVLEMTHAKLELAINLDDEAIEKVMQDVVEGKGFRWVDMKRIPKVSTLKAWDPKAMKDEL